MSKCAVFVYFCVNVNLKICGILLSGAIFYFEQNRVVLEIRPAGYPAIFWYPVSDRIFGFICRISGRSDTGYSEDRIPNVR